MIAAPARFRSSTARMKTLTISGRRGTLIGLPQDAEHLGRPRRRPCSSHGRPQAAAVAGSSGSRPRSADARDVGHRPRHGSGNIRQQVERHRPRCSSPSRSNADQRLMHAGRGVAGIAAQSRGAEAGDRRRRAAADPAVTRSASKFFVYREDLLTVVRRERLLPCSTSRGRSRASVIRRTERILAD